MGLICFITQLLIAEVFPKHFSLFQTELKACEVISVFDLPNYTQFLSPFPLIIPGFLSREPLFSGYILISFCSAI